MSLVTPRKGYKSVPWLFGKEIEIPEEWEVRKLESLVTLLTNGFVGKAKEHYTESENGVLYIQGYNIEENNFKFHGIKYVTPQFHKQQQKSNLQLGDLLTVQTGNVGTTAIISKSLVGANCHALIISRFKKEIADSDYFCQYFNSRLCQKSFKSIEIGTSLKHLNGSDMKRLQFVLPPLPEQQKIATILSNVDNLIDSTVQVIAHSKKVKTGLMQKLLTQGIGHTKFKKITMGLRYMLETYPEEWIISTLGENAELQRGKFGHRPRDDPEFYDGKYPFIQTGDVEKSNKYILTYSQTLNEKGLKVSKIFPKGIIVITIAANIGSTSITTFDTCFPDSLIGISTNSMNIEFLEYFMNTRKNYLNAVATTSAQKNINYETLKPLKIPVPPLSEQQKNSLNSLKYRLPN